MWWPNDWKSLVSARTNIYKNLNLDNIYKNLTNENLDQLVSLSLEIQRISNTIDINKKSISLEKKLLSKENLFKNKIKDLSYNEIY